jgi:hypothetical protein
MHVWVWTEKIDGVSDEKAEKGNGCQEAEEKGMRKEKRKRKRKPMTRTIFSLAIPHRWCPAPSFLPSAFPGLLPS